MKDYKNIDTSEKIKIEQQIFQSAIFIAWVLILAAFYFVLAA